MLLIQWITPIVVTLATLIMSPLGLLAKEADYTQNLSLLISCFAEVTFDGHLHGS